MQSRETPQEERLTHFVLSLAFVPRQQTKQVVADDGIPASKPNILTGSSQYNASSFQKERVDGPRSGLPASKPALLAPLSGSSVTLEGYGSCCFKGAVADKYLKEQGYGASLLKDLSWPKDEVKALRRCLQWREAIFALVSTDGERGRSSRQRRLLANGYV